MQPTIISETSQKYDRYWQNTEFSYPWYPTIRHRKRFITNTVKRYCPSGQYTLFDFGCGEGSLLQHIRDKCELQEEDLGGSDISHVAVRRAQTKLKAAHFFHGAFPETEKLYDIVVCSEVIEHTTDYKKILAWIHEHLRENGILILTTQSGRLHASDRYTHHTQHFKKKTLEYILKKTGFATEYSHLWGWPLFTAQKYLTDVNFRYVQNAFLEGWLSPRKRLIFSMTYTMYFLHDLIPFGPQIYIVARKPAISSPRDRPSPN